MPEPDFVQLQTDLTQALLSEPLLAAINVIQYAGSGWRAK